MTRKYAIIFSILAEPDWIWLFQIHMVKRVLSLLSSMTRGIGLSFAGILLVTGALQAVVVRVVSSGGFATAYRALAPEFERATRNTLVTSWGPSMGNTGIDLVGPLPPEVQKITIFSAGIVVGALEPDAARALIAFLASPAAAAAIKESGMEPMTSAAPETARALASANAEVTLAVRNIEAGQRTANDIGSCTGNKQVLVAPLDLANQASISAFIANSNGPLHILVNNAGMMASPELRTPEGWEMQFATNHLGHVALAIGLHDALAAAKGARIAVCDRVRSAVHQASAAQR
jgi:hypothetical protein